jgi:hypothetical protein
MARLLSLRTRDFTIDSSLPRHDDNFRDSSRNDAVLLDGVQDERMQTVFPTAKDIAARSPVREPSKLGSARARRAELAPLPRRVRQA